jgi:hypothetical protein
MGDGITDLAKVGLEAVVAIAKEIPAIRKLFTAQDDQIRKIARDLQEEIIKYCNQLEESVYEARHELNNDSQLLGMPLGQVDVAWAQRKGRLRTFYKKGPARKIKTLLLDLAGFADRLTALLVCQGQNEQLDQRDFDNGRLTVSYSSLVGSNPPIGEILNRIEQDANHLRSEAAALGTL